MILQQGHTSAKTSFICQQILDFFL